VVKPLDAITLQRAVDAIVPRPGAPKTHLKVRREGPSDSALAADAAPAMEPVEVAADPTA